MRRSNQYSGKTGSGSTSGSSSSSISSSSSSSGSFGDGSSGGRANNPVYFSPQPTGVNNNFVYPTGFGYQNPGNLPFQDFNVLFQQFLANLNAAQQYAAQDPNYAQIYNQQISALLAQQAAAAQNTRFPNVNYNSAVPDPSQNVYTRAGVEFGPRGGYGSAQSFPGGADGLGVRIASEFPAPSGGSFGVFSSSSSGTSDVNGRKSSFKSSTFGTNDNGKITFRTINE